ncbi:RsiV family protein [Legionella dresdenensis]|uniref:RsiV family protein n=1 Tax=Legionella dresdenensis TaxID=450200 RepID=A0ABV8CI56_9GAMM
MNKFTMAAASLLLVLSGVNFNVYAKTVEVKKETKNLILDIKYPQGFNKPVDQTIKKLVDSAQKKAVNDSVVDDLPADVPGKNGLYINFQQQFQNQHALSLQFDISYNARGAAHPNNTIKTLNFIDGKEVGLDQLFKPNSGYLAKLAEISRNKFLENKDFDPKWVTEGTEPKIENYKNWYFSQSGLVIVFDTYQVAAYVYGPQTVTVPYAVLKDMLQERVSNLVWGN